VYQLGYMRPDKLITTIKDKVGEPIGEDTAKSIIKTYWKQHPQLNKWQLQLLRDTLKLGHVSLPIFGHSRGFAALTPKDHPTVCNFPIQRTAATIFQAAQILIQKDITRLKIQAHITHQVHDSLDIDTPSWNEPIIRGLFKKHIPTNQYLEDLFTHYGRRIPIEYTVTIKRNQPNENRN